MTGPIKALISDRYDRVPTETMRSQLGRRSGLRIVDVLATVRGLGLSCTWRSDVRQFRVAFRGRYDDTESSAYYADDGQDAIDTARAMVRDAAADIAADVIRYD